MVTLKSAQANSCTIQWHEYDEDMAKDDRESTGGLVVDVFGEDDQGRLRHQPEVVEGLHKCIDRHRGKSSAELTKALGVASDPVEKDAIRMYSIANFRKDPLEDAEEDESEKPQNEKPFEF